MVFGVNQIVAYVGVLIHNVFRTTAITVATTIKDKNSLFLPIETVIQLSISSLYFVVFFSSFTCTLYKARVHHSWCWNIRGEWLLNSTKNKWRKNLSQTKSSSKWFIFCTYFFLASFIYYVSNAIDVWTIHKWL